jgi:hypothetical protein
MRWKPNSTIYTVYVNFMWTLSVEWSNVQITSLKAQNPSNPRHLAQSLLQTLKPTKYEATSLQEPLCTVGKARRFAGTKLASWSGCYAFVPADISQLAYQLIEHSFLFLLLQENKSFKINAKYNQILSITQSQQQTHIKFNTTQYAPCKETYHGKGLHTSRNCCSSAVLADSIVSYNLE